MTDDLIDRIYESSFVPELWPGILDALSDIAGARGGVLFAAHSKVLNWTATANLAETFRAYVGWLRGIPVGHACSPILILVSLSNTTYGNRTSWIATPSTATFSCRAALAGRPARPCRCRRATTSSSA
jgi:hypothetical protein